LKKEYPQIKEDDRILLFVGRLGKEKNISFLLKVFKKVLLEEIKVKFVIVGGGSEKEELEKLAMELNIADNVIFTGSQPREKVIDAYKQAYLFVFASYTETQGLVILESMAAGTPVVALGKLGVYDILSQEDAGGIMIKNLNEVDFSNEILKLLKESSTYEELKEKAKIFVKNNYSIEKCVDMILELYKREILTV